MDDILKPKLQQMESLTAAVRHKILAGEHPQPEAGELDDLVAELGAVQRMRDDPGVKAAAEFTDLELIYRHLICDFGMRPENAAITLLGRADRSFGATYEILVKARDACEESPAADRDSPTLNTTDHYSPEDLERDLVRLKAIDSEDIYLTRRPSQSDSSRRFGNLALNLNEDPEKQAINAKHRIDLHCMRRILLSCLYETLANATPKAQIVGSMRPDEGPGVIYYIDLAC